MSETRLDEFLEWGKDRPVTPVIRRLFADSETPMGLYRKLSRGPGSFLLESADQAGKWSRYSFLGVAVHGVVSHHGGRAVWLSQGMSEVEAFGTEIPVKALDALEVLHQRWLSDPLSDLPPFAGGLVGHIGWEAVREVERLPHPPMATHAVPAMHMALVKDFVAFDHHSSEVVLVALTHSISPVGEDEYRDAISRLDAMHEALTQPTSSTLHQKTEPVEELPHPSLEDTQFFDMVARAKKHIDDGDVFQVVLSQQFVFEVDASPLEVYRVLRSVNPSPYMYLLECQGESGDTYHVVGSSPEALVTLQRGKVYSHPIAGSRPRGASAEEDNAHSQELLADTKEQAEHLMLVDLARNDLSKVCDAGTVEVTEFMQVERFSHIMHLVSSVEGDLSADKSAVDVFRATFPAGTLSGAPKPRALEIIDDLEPTQRGVYGGVVGYFGHSGDADLAITIRTIWMQGSRAIVQAGAGIVADSDPESEYRETIHKASAPARAIRIANALKPDLR
ncbi:MAG: anthranilate synthase component I [Pontimonas sp.]|nr:anthranilate synthase component I [Pontimonas sp.]